MKRIDASRRLVKASAGRRQVRLSPAASARSENEVEEFHGVGEGGQPAVMEVGRRVLDPPQRKGFDRPVGQRHEVVVGLAD
jgi:hypothetical protein